MSEAIQNLLNKAKIEGEGVTPTQQSVVAPTAPQAAPQAATQPANILEGFQDLDWSKSTSAGGELPLGTHVVSFGKVDIKTTKSGKPMVQVVFTVVDGESTGQTHLDNFVLKTNAGATNGFALRNLKKFLELVTKGTVSNAETLSQAIEVANTLPEDQRILKLVITEYTNGATGVKGKSIDYIAY